MKIKADSYTTEEYEELRKITGSQVCAVCGGYVSIHTTEDGYLEVWCPRNGELPAEEQHGGFAEQETYTQSLRRGAIVHPSIQRNIERKMLINRPGALNLIKHRYPAVDWDNPSAGLFLLDCIRLSLDPFLGEIIPVSFSVTVKATGQKVTVVQPIITEDGYLSLAARACPNDWTGPPMTMRLEEYLATQSQYKDKPYEEIKQIAADIKLDMCYDSEAYLWIAKGHRRDQEDVIAYGWYKTAEQGKVAAGLPGNQARVRAIKRWVREVFPEAKSNMQEMTAEWMERAEGVQEWTEVIEAEYQLLETNPPSKPEGDETEGAEDIKGEDPGAAPQTHEGKSPKGAEPPKKSRKSAAARDPDTLSTLNDLYKACNEDFGLQPSQVVTELGLTSQTMITDTPAQCYRIIAASRS